MLKLIYSNYNVKLNATGKRFTIKTRVLFYKIKFVLKIS